MKLFHALAACVLFAVSVQAQPVPDVLLGRALPSTVRDFCDDVNRQWARTTPFPSSYPWNSEYVEYYVTVTERLRHIVLSKPPPNVSRFYRSFTDMVRRDELGLRPLERELRAIDAVRTPADLARLIARFHRRHRSLVVGERSPTPTPFHIEVGADPSDSKRQIVQITQGGLGLPDRSYYIGDEPALAGVREKYREHLARVFRLAGESQPEKAAADAFELESSFARSQSTLSQLQDQQIPRRVSPAELAAIAPTFDWSAYLREAALDAKAPVLLRQPAYIKAATDVMAKSPPGQLRAWFKWQLLRRYSPFLSRSFADASFDFFSRTVQGARERQPVEQQALEFVSMYLQDELSQAYVERHVSADMRAKATAIAEDVRSAYRERIETAGWLSSQTRTEASRKLATLKIDMLYPEHREPLPAVSLPENRLIDALILLSERDAKIARERAGKPTNREIWWDLPVTVSGSYSQSRNMLIITAARALPPLFDPAASDAANYGGLGTLVGHEMGHALDNYGGQYDADGNVRDWWAPEDKKEFERRTGRLIEQYSRFAPLPGMPLDGKAELPENIGDLSGLTLGYEALKRARRLQSRPLTLDDERQFFEAWARRWRVQYTEGLLLQIVKSDTHPPLQYRCTVPLSNFTPFYDAVGIDPASPAYLRPDDRVSIW